MKVDMHEAKSQLSRLGRLAWEGEEIVIAKAGEPWLRLVPYRKARPHRKLGALRGRTWIAPDVDDTPSAVSDLFDGSTVFPEPED